MLISFTVETDDGFFITKLVGKINDDDFIHAYRQFFRSDSWSPDLNELVDLTDADLSKVTRAGLSELALIIQEIYLEQRKRLKTAVFAEEKYHHTLAMMYTEFLQNSPQSVAIFSEINEAKSWLCQETVKIH